MALKLLLTKEEFDALDEGTKKLYGEKDGKFQLDVDGMEDTTGLKNALAAERKKAQDLEKEVAKWKKAGKTPEEIATMIAEREEQERKKLESEGQWDSLKTQMNEAHAKTVKEKDDAIAKLQGQLNSALIEGEAVREVAAAKGTAVLLLPHIKSRAKLFEVDGQPQVRIVDDKGEPRIDGTGRFLGIKDLVAELKTHAEFGRAFEASSSGGGTPQGGGGGAPGNQQRSKMTPADKAAYVAEHGQEAYFKLPN